MRSPHGKKRCAGRWDRSCDPPPPTSGSNHNSVTRMLTLTQPLPLLRCLPACAICEKGNSPVIPITRFRVAACMQSSLHSPPITRASPPPTLDGLKWIPKPDTARRQPCHPSLHPLANTRLLPLLGHWLQPRPNADLRSGTWKEKLLIGMALGTPHLCPAVAHWSDGARSAHHNSSCEGGTEDSHGRHRSVGHRAKPEAKVSPASSFSLLGILNAHRKNPQAYGYQCSFHPRVFQSIDFHGEHEVY